MRIEGGITVFETLPHVAAAWLDSDHRPRIIVRTDGTEIWSSPGAKRLFATCPSIRLVGGVVRLEKSEHDAQFVAFLKGLSADVRTLAIKFADEDSYCVFRGRRVSAADRCCVDVRFSSAQLPPILLDFDRTFGLTVAEAKTANALYSGLSAREIAAEQRITVDTVRSHIRQLYSKIGVSGREQLFRQLDAFRVD